MFERTPAALRKSVLPLLGGALLLFTLLAAYANHFHNSFHFDDAHTIVNNASIRELKDIPLFFGDARSFSLLPSNQSYRPLVTTLLTSGRECIQPREWSFLRSCFDVGCCI
jgi:hypothetical protein